MIANFTVWVPPKTGPETGTRRGRQAVGGLFGSDLGEHEEVGRERREENQHSTH